MEFTITFVKIFMWGVYLMFPILAMMSFLIIILGLIVGRIESWPRFDALYWAFITALTIGYGDMRPVKRISRMISVLLGTFGIMLTGVLVAITVEASSNTFNIHVDQEVLDRIEQSVEHGA
jgi:voltage-gated potassium channel